MEKELEIITPGRLIGRRFVGSKAITGSVRISPSLARGGFDGIGTAIER